SENEEAMIRTDRWKLIYQTGNRVREDGYATSIPPERRVRLYDMASDPAELKDLASTQGEMAETLLKQLAEHMVETSRMPEAIPNIEDPFEILDHCLQPRDVTGP